MFTVEMLPARHGDALWIEYGDAMAPHCLLVDGGARSRATESALRARLTERVIEGPGSLDLVMVTHIDADHITGILKLLKDRTLPMEPGDVWFNGWDHLPTDVLGAKQGEELSTAIVERGLPWNDAFGGAAVMIPDSGAPPVKTLAGGMELTVLSPGRRQLAELRPVWEAEVRKAGLVPGYGVTEAEEEPDVLGDEEDFDPEELAAEPFEDDDSAANGASIAVIAAFDGRSVLLTGDARAGVLGDGLRRQAAVDGGGRVRLDAFKVSHHGSKYNVSNELLGLVDCERFLFSSNGRTYHHPDATAVSRVVVSEAGRSLAFNYRTAYTEPWKSSRMQRRFMYSAAYPDPGSEGLIVAI